MFARTKRLTLRPGWPEDAAALASAITFEAVAMRLARLPWPYTLDHARAFLCEPSMAGDVRLLVFAHESAGTRLVGGAGLERQAGAHALGYWLTPDAWGLGYATEAGAAMLGIARHALGCRRLVAHAHADNPASQRVLAKLGFQPTGRGSRASLARGGLVPAISYELDLAEEGARPALAA